MVDQSLSQLLVQHGVDDQTATQLQNTISGSDLINLINCLTTSNSTSAVAQANQILRRYGVSIKEAAMNTDRLHRMYKGLDSTKEVAEQAEQPIEHLTPIAESDNPEDRILAMEGFNYIAVMEQPALSDQLIEWLDQNKIEFLTNGKGHFHIKCEDRDHAYKVGRTISGLMRKQRYVRDSIAPGEARVAEKTNWQKRANQAKDKLAAMTPPNPHAKDLQRMQSKAGVIDPKRKIDQRDERGRGAKHKKRQWDEAIDGVESANESAGDTLSEGVVGFADVIPLFRLRELAGLPPTPMEPPVDPAAITPPAADLGGSLNPTDVSTDIAPADPVVDAVPMQMEPTADIPGDIDPMAPDADVPVDVDVVGGVTPSQAMASIDDHLNNVQLQLPDIKMSEYKMLVHKLQDLATQLQAMGRDYLGERRALKK
jgi:hypothetical protein